LTTRLCSWLVPVAVSANHLAFISSRGCQCSSYWTAPDEIEQCIKDFREKHEPRRILGLAGDLTSAEHVRYCLRETIARFGRLDVVVANIGSGRGRIDYDLDDREWMIFFQVNLFSGVRLVREGVPYLKEKQAWRFL